MENDKKFQIDFFELAFLAEACIPPRPIARSMFWDKLIDVYWEQMSENERMRLWEWLNKNWVYKESLEKGNEQVLMFEARYNPDNQYEIEVSMGDGIKTYRSFFFENQYHLSSNRWIQTQFIKNITISKLR